jgi:hypothetical protein
MAKLVGPVTRILELAPLAYEHPELYVDGYPAHVSDQNWVVVRIAVHSEAHSWTAEFPAFTTWDLEKMVEWCRAIARNSTGVEPHRR